MAYFSVDEEAEDPEEGAWEVTFAGTQVRGCRGSRGGSVGGDVSPGKIEEDIMVRRFCLCRSKPRPFVSSGRRIRR